MVPMVYESIGDEPPCFQPCQIVCLQHESSCLYAEVVQIVESRQLCWVRPLVLTLRPAESTAQSSTFWEQSGCYDLRQDSDLLLPLTLFRAALDTEVLPWLSSLYVDDRPIGEQGGSKELGRGLFRQFIHQVWQAHSEIFQKRANSGKM